MKAVETWVRPKILEFEDPIQFLKAMLTYRKKTERSFSVLKVCRGLRRVSPTLVSLILKGQRKITFDRVDEFSKLMNLSTGEKHHFRALILGIGGETFEKPLKGSVGDSSAGRRKVVSVHILNDWINPYVKDCFQIEQVQKQPKLLPLYLANLATSQRVEKALQFLLREGHLRRELSGRIVLDTPLAVTDTEVPSKKIRAFHKGALQIAKNGMDLFSSEERFSNTMVVPLNAQTYQQLIEMITDFSQRLQDFAALAVDSGDRLYQVLVNVCPTGGRSQ